MIRKTSVRCNIPEETVQKITLHQWRSIRSRLALENGYDCTTISATGFFTFHIMPSRVYYKLVKYLDAFEGIDKKSLKLHPIKIITMANSAIDLINRLPKIEDAYIPPDNKKIFEERRSYFEGHLAAAKKELKERTDSKEKNRDMQK